jgi:hypothetical protein
MRSLLILIVMMWSLEPKILFSQFCATGVNACGHALKERGWIRILDKVAIIGLTLGKEVS